MARNFQNIKVGDEVTRLLAGVIPLKLKVTEISEDGKVIICGAWKFDRTYGIEIDDAFPHTIMSFLKDNEVSSDEPTT